MIKWFIFLVGIAVGWGAGSWYFHQSNKSNLQEETNYSDKDRKHLDSLLKEVNP